MILQALARYYDDLLQQGKISAPGWTKVKISYALDIGLDGQLKQVIPTRQDETVGKKTVQRPQEMVLPAPIKKTSGASSNFLWENSGYLLGIKQKEEPQRSLKCFETARELHHALLDEVDSPNAKAILRFFDSWQPEEAAQHPMLSGDLDEITAGGNLVFRIEGTYPQEDSRIREAWDKARNSSSKDAVKMQCLITGQEDEIVAVHPSIKGVRDAQSSGAALVSFNAPAFESYGKESARVNQGQGRNAQVGRYAAFAYGAALNYMVGQADFHGRLGDTTLVYWAEGAEPAYGSAFMAMMGMGGEEKNEITQKELNGVLTALCQGRTVNWANVPLNPKNRFYILGLAPNASRISVRFFLRDSFSAFVEHYQKHQERLNIVRPAFDERETLSMWALLRETVNPNSRDKSAQPQLVGELLRAVLTGSLYPSAMFTQTEIRLRAEKEITRG